MSLLPLPTHSFRRDGSFLGCWCAVALLIGISTSAIAQSGRIAVEYVAPANPVHEPIYKVLKERRALEKLQEIFSPFQLPVDLTLRTVGCGQSNAWYYRQAVSVCYEYLAEIRKHLPLETTQAGVTPTDAMLGQFFYVFAHEMGHAVFDTLAIPVFGRLEDAADQFAVYIMLQFGKADARRLVTGAAYSYRDSVLHPNVDEPLKLFSDAHGLPAQRFYNLLCLAYGADSQLFADFVDKGYLPKGRASDCRREHGEVAYAFQKLIVPHLDKALARKVLDKSWLPEESVRSPSR